jgi:hypothetical protein
MRAAMRITASQRLYIIIIIIIIVIIIIIIIRQIANCVNYGFIAAL